MGSVAAAGARRAIAAALVLTVTVPSLASAQSGLKSNRKWLFGAIGAVSLGLPAYMFTSEDTFDSTCSSQGCAGAVAAVIGGIIGFMVGAELDSRYTRRMEAGPDIDYRFRYVPLDLVPDRMTEYPGGAAVVGLGGARLVRRDGSVSPRAVGVRGIEDVAVLPTQDLLVLSTFANLLSFPISDDSAQGQVIDERGGGAMQVFQENLAVAGLDSLRLLRVSSRDQERAVRTIAGVETFDFVTDMAFSDFGRVGWVLQDDRLSSFSAGLRRIGELRLPAVGRSIRARGGRLVVAAGTNGVYVLDATDPGDPRVVSHYTGLRFSYAADIEGDLLYVAGGPEGVAVVDVGGADAIVLGVARDARFATDVVATGDGEVWILDRDGRRIQIAEFTPADVVTRRQSTR